MGIFLLLPFSECFFVDRCGDGDARAGKGADEDIWVGIYYLDVAVAAKSKMRQINRRESLGLLVSMVGQAIDKLYYVFH